MALFGNVFLAISGNTMGYVVGFGPILDQKQLIRVNSVHYRQMHYHLGISGTVVGIGAPHRYHGTGAASIKRGQRRHRRTVLRSAEGQQRRSGAAAAADAC